MDCPPPLSSDDEDDDFGDFSTFEKAGGFKGGSIKSRIHLDTPLSPEPGDSHSFPIPPKHADFSIDSDSSPPELPPSLPMSPETPDVDFFSRTGDASPPPLHFSENSNTAAFSDSQNNDLFSSDVFEKSGAASHAPKAEDFFADFATPEKNNLPADDDFFPFQSSGSNDALDTENFDVDFTDFSAPMSGVVTEHEIENSSEVTDDISTEPDKFSAKINHVETGLSDMFPEEVAIEVSSADNTCKSENSLDQATVNPSNGDEDTSQEIASPSQVKEEEFVSNFDSETPSPVRGGKSVFSWDSSEENVDIVVDDTCEKKTDNFLEDNRQYGDMADKAMEAGGDDFHGFANFDLQLTGNVMNSDQPKLDSNKDDRNSETGLDFFADENEEKSRLDNDNVRSDSQDEFNRFTWDFQNEDNEIRHKTSEPADSLSEKVTSDQCDDFTKEETDNSTQKEDPASAESFGNLADLKAPSEDGELSTSADLKNTAYEEDFGAFDNGMVTATTTIGATVSETTDHDGLDDNFGDFGAFDNKKPCAASGDEKPSETPGDGLGDNFGDFGAFDDDKSAKTADDGLDHNFGDFGAFDNDEPAKTTDDGLDHNFGDFGARAIDNDEPAKTADDGLDDDFGDFGTFDNDEPAKTADDGLDDNFGDFGGFDNDKPVKTADDGLDDDFGDFGAIDNDEPAKTADDGLDDDFGDFGAFDNDKSAKTADDGLDDNFGDFGAFDNDKSAKTADDDFDDFADFDSASQKPDPKPPVKSKSQPLSLSKMIIECYGDCKGDKEEAVGSGDYSDGLNLMTKVQDTDAQFAVCTKWLTTPSFNTQVNTLCLSSSNTGSSTSKPAKAQKVAGDEFSVFGSVETDQKLTDQTLVSSGLIPDDLSAAPSPAPTPSKKHAAILSGYKKEETKQLSREAAAIVDSLPDLTFMLSSVLMFPVKSS